MGPSSASGLVRLCASRIEWLRELAATARSKKKASSSSEWFSIGSRTELRTKHIGPNTTSYATAGCLSDVTILVSAVSLCLPHRVASRGLQYRLAVGASRSSECFFNRLKHRSTHKPLRRIASYHHRQMENAIKRYTVDGN